MTDHEAPEPHEETQEPTTAPDRAPDVSEVPEAPEAPEDTEAVPGAPGPSEALEEAPEAAVDGTEEPDTLAIPLAELRPALEAVLMVADQPLDQVTLASAVGYPVEEVATALRELADDYAAQGRGFDLRNVAGGWRYYTREEYAGVVEKFVLDGQQARLTQAALETLAVVAYKQPVSRARVSAVRGVNVDGVMRTLLARGLVEECGHDEETSATLYRTTSYFLERIGVTSIDELPELAPFLPEMGDLEELEESMRSTPTAAPAATEQSTERAGAQTGEEAGDQTGEQPSQETV